MRHLLQRAYLLAAVLCIWAAPLGAQPFPTMAPNTVVGRLGGGVAGPPQAIPFAVLTAQLFGANTKSPLGGDVYFGSGRPWCDPRAASAKGDGVTDDDAAFVACLTTLTSLSPAAGGEIHVSPGHYCLQSGAFSAALAASNVAIAFVGTGRLVSNTLSVSWMDTCGADVDLVHLNATGSSVRGLRITGAPFTTNPAHNALTLTNDTIVENSFVEGGYYAVATASGVADWTLIDNLIRNSYGPAVIEVTASGGYLKRNKVDGHSFTSGPTAWSAGATVIAGQALTTGGFNIIYSVGGTTGGSPPALQKYGTDFADGTATAHLGGPVTQYALEVNAALAISEQNDFSGGYLYGVHVTGTGAQFNSVSDDATADLNGAILIDNGQASILNGIFGSCVSATCKVVNITPSALGATIGSGTQIGGGGTGIEYDAGTALQVTGVRFFGLTNGVNVGTANLSNISIVAGVFGYNSSAVTNGIVFQGGTSDYVNIVGNAFQLNTTPFTGSITGSHNHNETLGVTCSGSPTSSFASINGNVTHC
jgi:hypothetical protein